VPAEPILSPVERAFLAEARRAVLATIDPHGQPRLVPICHVVGDDDKLGRPKLYTPIDEKPKASPDPRRLSRIRDLLILPAATILADQSGIPHENLTLIDRHETYSHNDPNSASPVNDFVDGLVPFLDKISRGKPADHSHPKN